MKKFCETKKVNEFKLLRVNAVTRRTWEGALMDSCDSCSCCCCWSISKVTAQRDEAGVRSCWPLRSLPSPLQSHSADAGCWRTAQEHVCDGENASERVETCTDTFMGTWTTLICGNFVLVALQVVLHILTSLLCSFPSWVSDWVNLLLGFGPSVFFLLNLLWFILCICSWPLRVFSTCCLFGFYTK